MDRTVDNLVTYLNAGYSGFIVQTTETKRADEVIYNLLEAASESSGTKYNVVSWDIDSAQKKDPLSPIDLLLKSAEDNTILLAHNYHWHLDKPPVIQKLQNAMDLLKSQGKAFIILSPYSKIPLEIRKDFVVMTLPLPNAEEIDESVNFIADSAGAPELKDNDNSAVANACKGLTKTEAENVLSLCITSTGGFDVNLINESKIDAIEKSGLLTVLRTKKTYKDIIGYGKAKSVVSKMIQKPTSKGSLFVGPPGCGKSLFTECTCGEYDLIAVVLNFGRLYSKFQGEGDANVETIIGIIQAIGRCAVIADEFEKQFAGAGSSGDTDSGVSRRMTGRWLRFMSEPHPDIYIMGTCNSFRGVPDEYLRVGRWDSSPFYIDMPNDGEKLAILDYYLKKFKLPKSDNVAEMPSMDNWTGAEIEGMCHMAKNLECSLAEAATFIIPQNSRGFAEAEEIKQFAIPASEINLPTGKARGSRKLKMVT